MIIIKGEGTNPVRPGFLPSPLYPYPSSRLPKGFPLWNPQLMGLHVFIYFQAIFSCMFPELHLARIERTARFLGRTYKALHDERCLTMSVRRDEQPLLHKTDVIISFVRRTYKALSNERSLTMSASPMS